MSESKRATRGSAAPPLAPTALTIEDVQRLKDLFEKTHLKWWIILAGAGGVAELLHIGWLAIRYVRKF